MKNIIIVVYECIHCRVLMYNKVYKYNVRFLMYNKVYKYYVCIKHDRTRMQQYTHVV